MDLDRSSLLRCCWLHLAGSALYLEDIYVNVLLEILAVIIVVILILVLLGRV